MCLGKVAVRKPSGPVVEVEDVVGIIVNGAVLQVSTLFGEMRIFSGMRIAQIDLRSGEIFLVEEKDNDSLCEA